MLAADVRELGDRTVGILGLGRIGQAVAARLAPFELGRLVYADAVAAPASVERRLGVERVDVDELCAVSDALTVHVPLLESTVGLLDRRRVGDDRVEEPRPRAARWRAVACGQRRRARTTPRWRITRHASEPPGTVTS